MTPEPDSPPSLRARVDHPEDLALLRGRHVRIYPRADADGGGTTAGSRWAAQLIAAGCTVDFCQPSSETGHNGRPAKDLIDLIHTPHTHRPDLIP